jgi:hypothetical protein
MWKELEYFNKLDEFKRKIKKEKEIKEYFD